MRLLGERPGQWRKNNSNRILGSKALSFHITLVNCGRGSDVLKRDLRIWSLSLDKSVLLALGSCFSAVKSNCYSACFYFFPPAPPSSSVISSRQFSFRAKQSFLCQSALRFVGGRNERKVGQHFHLIAATRIAITLRRRRHLCQHFIECCHPTAEWLITKAMHDSSHPNRNPTEFLFHELRNSCVRKDDRRRLSLAWNQERCSRFCVCKEKRNKSAEISRICLQLCRRCSML